MITQKRPPYKESVGAQYIVFATKGEGNDDVFTGEYSPNVEKTETVKKVGVSENSETSNITASGKVYSTSTLISSIDISVEVVAFPAETVAEARGDNVTESGLVLSGGQGIRPYFAYGKVVRMQGGKMRYDWYPKCKLSANTDDIETSEDKFKEQNDTLTIQAMPFNDNNDIVVSIKADIKMPEGLTEELFFSKPILCEKDLLDLLKLPTDPAQGEPANE